MVDRASEQPLIHVVAAVITRGSKYLLCQRPTNKRHPGLWEFPGGKLEAGEDHLEAARRELAEELGVRVTGAGDVVASIQDPGSVFVIDFVPVQIDGEPEALEHAALGWLDLQQIRQMELAPSDAAFVSRLAKS